MPMAAKTRMYPAQARMSKTGATGTRAADGVVVAGPGLDHQQIRRPAAQHLMRQMDGAVARIAGLSGTLTHPL
jgi:hypothetical protein